MDKKDATNRQIALMLAEFNYTIRHRAKTRRKHVDALNRSPVLYAISVDLNTRIRRAQQMDNRVRAIIEILKEKPYEDYTLLIYRWSFI